jgi:hypothetical protein
MLSVSARQARDQAADLQMRVHPALAARPDVLREQPGQASSLGERHHGNEAASARGHETIALARCPLGMGDGKRRELPSSQLRGHLSRYHALKTT